MTRHPMSVERLRLISSDEMVDRARNESKRQYQIRADEFSVWIEKNQKRLNLLGELVSAIGCYSLHREAQR